MTKAQYIVTLFLGAILFVLDEAAENAGDLDSAICTAAALWVLFRVLFAVIAIAGWRLIKKLENVDWSDYL